MNSFEMDIYTETNLVWTLVETYLKSLQQSTI